MAENAVQEQLKAKEEKVVLEQFRRNLDHLVQGNDTPGPELTIGDVVLTFKRKVPVRALAALIGTDNRLEGMQTYIRKTLVPGQDESFDSILDQIDVDGLGEILNVLGEAYTSFPAESQTE